MKRSMLWTYGALALSLQCAGSGWSADGDATLMPGITFPTPTTIPYPVAPTLTLPPVTRLPLAPPIDLSHIEGSCQPFGTTTPPVTIEQVYYRPVLEAVTRIGDRGAPGFLIVARGMPTTLKTTRDDLPADTWLALQKPGGPWPGGTAMWQLVEARRSPDNRVFSAVLPAGALTGSYRLAVMRGCEVRSNIVALHVLAPGSPFIYSLSRKGLSRAGWTESGGGDAELGVISNDCQVRVVAEAGDVRREVTPSACELWAQSGVGPVHKLDVSFADLPTGTYRISFVTSGGRWSNRFGDFGDLREYPLAVNRVFQERLAEKFRHDRCVNCHNFAASGTVGADHHADGRDQRSCGECHNSRIAPRDLWRAPDASMRFGSDDLVLCKQALLLKKDALGYLSRSSDADIRRHLLEDPRILWGLFDPHIPDPTVVRPGRRYRGPGLPEEPVPGGYEEWRADVEAWLAASPSGTPLCFR